MELDEFIEATGKLERYYNKEYPKEEFKIMHEEIQKLNFSIERYKFLISKVIQKSKYLPKVCDFVAANLEFPDREVEEKKEKIICKKCNSTGYIIYSKQKKDGNQILEYKYAAICNCGNAKQYKGWETTPKSDYYTPTASELNLL